MVLLMKALKLLGPWHQEAAARALSGTDQDVLDYLRTRWKEANHNDIRQRVVELSTQSPYTSVRTVATEVLSGHLGSHRSNRSPQRHAGTDRSLLHRRPVRGRHRRHEGRRRPADQHRRTRRCRGGQGRAPQRIRPGPRQVPENRAVRRTHHRRKGYRRTPDQHRRAGGSRSCYNRSRRRQRPSTGCISGTWMRGGRSCCRPRSERASPSRE